MTLREMITAYLREHGHDGLAGEDCGCTLADLMPCGEVSVDHCVAGKRVPCPGVSAAEDGATGCAYGGGCAWHVVPASEDPNNMTKNHTEKIGHCPACAAELEQLGGRVQRLEQLLEQLGGRVQRLEQLLEDLDGTLARFIRGKRPEPVMDSEIEALRKEIGS